MLLNIKWNQETEHWEVSQECGYVVYTNDLRRDCIFYCRDRQDDDSDQAERITAYNRDGSIAWES